MICFLTSQVNPEDEGFRFQGFQVLDSRNEGRAAALVRSSNLFIVLDGLRLFEEITYADSMGRTFYAIPDGSYLFIEGGCEELRGEACRIRDGRMERISENGQRVLLDQNGGTRS